jgi:hypothetical protein
MPQKGSGQARGDHRTGEVKPAGEQTIPPKATRQPSRRFPESREALRRLTRKDLMEMGHRIGLQGWSRLKKEELFQALWTRLKRPAPQVNTLPPLGLLEWANAPLPEAYDKDRLVLMPIDPYWVHAYWEIAAQSVPEPRSGAEKGSGQARYVLRVYDVTFIHFDGTNAHSFFDIEITPETRNWYINLLSPGKSLCADLGLVQPDGTFSALVRSNVIQTSTPWVSPNTQERWVRVEEDHAEHLPRRDAAHSEVVESVRQSEAREPSESPDPEELETLFQTQEDMVAEEYRRFAEETSGVSDLPADQPTLSQPSEAPVQETAGGSEEPETPLRTQECVVAEEYRRIIEETRRVNILRAGQPAPPQPRAIPVLETTRVFDTGLSSLNLLKKAWKAD